MASATWAIEMQLAGTAGAWSDVSNDVVISDKVRFESGIRDNGPTDRVASTGRLTFTLDNSTNNSAGLAGYYSPGHTNARTGFSTGIPVRLRISYDGATRTKFYGRIAANGIKPTPGVYGKRRTEVTVLDWMNQAATHEITLPEYTTNKRIDEIVPLIVANMPLAPLATDYRTGTDTFTSVFDSISGKTRALTEFNKLALSEYGYIYVRPTTTSDEVLVVEGRDSRASIGTALSVVPVSSDMCDFLACEDDTLLMTEAPEFIVVEETQLAEFNNTAVEPVFSFGKHLANDLKVTYYPRKIDAAATILFTLQSPIEIAAGGSVTNYVCNYRDPIGAASYIGGKSMEVPVATIDYLFNALSAGTGADYTADLTVTATYGAEAVSYTLENVGTATGFVTKLQARGLGIYLYDSVDINQQVAESQEDHGTQTLNIDMVYQDEPSTAQLISALEKYNLSDPRLELDELPFYANRDDLHMAAFIALGIGDRIHYVETQTGFDRDRYIDGVSCEISPCGIMKVMYRTRFISSITSWYLGVTGSSELEVSTILA